MKPTKLDFEQLHEVTRKYDLNGESTKLPGSMVSVPRNKTRRWESFGWVEKCGQGTVLLVEGYKQA